MNREYWQEFYKNNPDILNTPTDFALFCQKFIAPKSTILDVGCGNGRDTYYFGKLNHRAIGIDFATLPKSNDNTIFLQSDINTIEQINTNSDVIYSRFFIHAIEIGQIESFLSWARGLFMAEFRIKGDNPVLYPDHERTLIEDKEILVLLISYGFDIMYYEKGRGLARYKEEDPLVVRVIAKK